MSFSLIEREGLDKGEMEARAAAQQRAAADMGRLDPEGKGFVSREAFVADGACSHPREVLRAALSCWRHHAMGCWRAIAISACALLVTKDDNASTCCSSVNVFSPDMVWFVCLITHAFICFVCRTFMGCSLLHKRQEAKDNGLAVPTSLCS